MMEYLTAGNLALAVSLALAAERILRALAPMTATDIDDKLVQDIDKAREWARDKAPLIYTIVEQARDVGRIVANKDKPAVFDAELAGAYQAVFGKPMPAQAAEEARVIARGLSAADKPANPPQAPSK